jgi:hypothetical protein
MKKAMKRKNIVKKNGPDDADGKRRKTSVELGLADGLFAMPFVASKFPS